MKKLILCWLFISVYMIAQSQCPTLLWSDEFDGENLDQSKWSYQIGDGCNIDLCGWGNNELQSYTTNNVTVEGGIATITARRESINNSDYSSSRIRTLDKGEMKYGRIEARIKLPKGQGIWPAFWMLPSDDVYGGWPQSGEIDIMEYKGQEEDIVHGTIHFGQPWPNNQFSTKTYTQYGSKFSDDFNVFALEWSNQSLKWFVNGYLYSSKTRSDLNGQRWPFDQDFHVLLNMAVGGNFSGNPNSSTTFPQTMEIDYVRIYDLVNRPYLSGPQTVANKAKGTFYRLSNLPDDAEVVWNIPQDAKLINGQGTNVIEIDWENNGGKISAMITSSCETLEYNVGVKVDGPIASETILENFDIDARITRTFNSGNFKDNVTNPNQSEVNSSALCAEYIRNGGELFDVIFYDVSDINNAADFVSGKKLFSLDIYTDAPVGTKILLQLENKSRANSNNYPAGRHSRYEVTTTKQNEWERLQIPFLDRPDGGVSHFGIDQIVILLAPNTNNNSTFFLDNFEIYSETTTSTEELDYGIEIFPNPAISDIQIKLKTGQSINSIKIYDNSGRLQVHKADVNSRHYTINITNLATGLYYIKIRTSSNDEIVKAVIKN